MDIIRQRVRIRRPYRQLLFECARLCTERGARPTAAKFYTNAVALLQSDPWNDNAEDASYEETSQLYLRAAECYLYMGNHGAANALLGTIFMDKCVQYAARDSLWSRLLPTVCTHLLSHFCNLQ